MSLDVLDEMISSGLHGVEEILKERYEQIHDHGFGLEHDVEVNSPKDLMDAAIFTLTGDPERYPSHWGEWFADKVKEKSHSEKLAVAGALLAAAYDRQHAYATTDH